MKSIHFTLAALLLLLATQSCQRSGSSSSSQLTSPGPRALGILSSAGGAGDGMGFEGRVIPYVHFDPSLVCTDDGPSTEILVARGSSGSSAQLVRNFCSNLTSPLALKMEDLTFSSDGSGTMSYQGGTFLPTPSAPEARVDSSSWQKYGVTLSSSPVPAPDGSASAYLIQETGVTDYHFVQSLHLSYVPGSIVTASIFIKPAGRSQLALKLQDPILTDYVQVLCDVSAGSTSLSIQSGSAAYLASGIQTLPNGWSRCWLSGIVTHQGTAGVELLGFLSAAPSTQFYSGNTAAGAYLWGGQVLPGTQ